MRFKDFQFKGEEGGGGGGKKQKSTRWQSLEVWSDIKSTTYVKKI